LKFNKKLIVPILFLLLFSGLAVAGPGDVMSKLFDSILQLTDINNLLANHNNQLPALLRLLIGITVFSLLYMAAKHVPVLRDDGNKNIRIVITVVISIISSIFIPDSVLLASGANFGIIFSALLVFGPVGAVLALILNSETNSKTSAGIKSFICLFLMSMVGVTTSWARGIGHLHSSPNFVTEFAGWLELILLILTVYYLIKMFANYGGSDDSGDSSISSTNSLTERDDDNDDDPTPPVPTGTVHIGPPPPPPSPSGPTRRNKGDDPNPPKDPILNDPKGKLIRGIKRYKPQKFSPPKDKRVLVDTIEPWFFSIRNQDGIGACAAFAGSSILEYIINRTNGRVNYEYRLSELFLYYNARGDKRNDVGTNANDLVKEMTNTGVCKQELWHFEDVGSDKWKSAPSDNCYLDAGLQKVLEVKKLSYDSGEWISSLADDHPICFSIDCPENFNSSVGKLYSKSEGRNRGGHRMVIVGYDSHYPDGKNKHECFKIRNSWGSSWGDKGYVWVPRKLFEDMVKSRGSPVFVFTGWKKDLKNKPKKQIQKAVSLEYNKDHIKEITKFVDKEKGWLGTEFEFLDKLREDIEQKNYSVLKKHQMQVGRSERKVDSFNKRIDKNLKKIIGKLPPKLSKRYEEARKKLLAISRTLVKEDSRYFGEIKVIIDKIITTEKFIKSYSDQYYNNKKLFENKNSAEKSLEESWSILAKLVSEAQKNCNGLIVQLNNIVSMNKELLK